MLQGFTITGGVAGTGGGILCDNSGPTIRHCVITGNQATRFTGGGVDCYNSTATFINCTIAGNYAARGGAGVSSDQGADMFTNCIIWDNTLDAVLAVEEEVSLRFCTVEGSWIGEGNLDSDPQFVAPGYWALPYDLEQPVPANTSGAIWVAGDYHLSSPAGHYDVETATWIGDVVSSLCIDGGDPNFSHKREPEPKGAYINMKD